MVGFLQDIQLNLFADAKASGIGDGGISCFLQWLEAEGFQPPVPAGNPLNSLFLVYEGFEEAAAHRRLFPQESFTHGRKLTGMTSGSHRQSDFNNYFPKYSNSCLPAKSIVIRNIHVISLQTRSNYSRSNLFQLRRPVDHKKTGYFSLLLLNK